MVLMNQTLPTVIGMGVVSRTTDTMFGGRRRSSKSGSKQSRTKSAGPKVHRGPRGGRYIIRKGRRIYI